MAEEEEQPVETQEETITRIVEAILSGFKPHSHRLYGMHNIVLGNPRWHPYFWTDIQGTIANLTNFANIAILHAIYFDAPMTISQLTCEITVAGGAGTFLRLGLYEDNGGTPVGGALLFDSGNIDANVIATINAVIAPALARQKGISTWAALITDSALLTVRRCHSEIGFNEVGAEMMNGCTYNQAFGAFADPCPAVAADAAVRFYGFVRVDSVQPL